MDDVIVRAHGQLYRWHRAEVTRVTSAEDLPVLRLGNTVLCNAGRTAGKGRKMSEPKTYKGERGLVVVTYVHTDLDDQPDEVELGVMLPKGIVWASPAGLDLIETQEVDHGC